MANSAPVNTRDLGLFIRDMIEDREFCTYYERRGDLRECRAKAEIVHVDVSDPDNLTVALRNGQTFTVRIIAGERK